MQILAITVQLTKELSVVLLRLDQSNNVGEKGHFEIKTSCSLLNIMSKVYSPLCSSLVTQFEIIYKNEQLIKALKVISGYYAFFTTPSALCMLYEIVIENLFRCIGARETDNIIASYS
ncbi:hypothetical protein T12_8868 [Trichinella patagoniensis]|uniref:Uncharacterized protein n=1 Tax=Trichinella patagoniensis TaxID=990121 RepID=A0A0V0ZIC8_9BILA|nr:hypothetical protein T12_8868 [Trichinella patagoniensis]